TKGPCRKTLAATGHVAHDFAHAIRQLPGHDVVAVASRSHDRAVDLVRRCCPAGARVRTNGSYSEMAADATLKVDAIYVATPPRMHCEMVLKHMAFGRATLCEKPLGLDLEEVEACYAASKEHGTLLIEGMATRCFPVSSAARRLLHEARVIGDVVGVQAEFGY
ncbi:hypothetical protein M885DRAFT_428565, partial [Pelagophyceae sp. CCMP2097]